jgi:alpha-N-arabinofuranosidase
MSLNARITVDLDRPLGMVDPRIFGGFIEHLGRCIYGGVYDEGSPLSDELGFRRDVLEAAKGLRIPVLRWPGGNFVSGYNWTDGIGPKDERPKRLENAWHSTESNRFGTDEFIEYCRALGAEPIICVNMGTGTMDDARAWVEYCNGTEDTYWANLRRQNGHDEPYNVKYWGLGNEVWGKWQIGHMSADDYVKKAIEFAKVMKWTDPSIELISCGRDGWSDWDSTVISGLIEYISYHSIHIYTGNDDFQRNVFEPHIAEFAIQTCQKLIERVRFEKKIDHEVTIAYDEWNVWFRERGGSNSLEERYNLSDALAVATFLNVFIRNCAALGMANLAQMVNVIAPIFTNPEGLYLQTIYHPLSILAEQVLPVAIGTNYVGPTSNVEEAGHLPFSRGDVARIGPFDLIDVSATRDEARSAITISLVNRSLDEDVDVDLAVFGGGLSGDIAVIELNAGDVNAANSFEHPEAVSPVTRTVGASPDGGLTLTLPAHSHTVLRGSL